MSILSLNMYISIVVLMNDFVGGFIGFIIFTCSVVSFLKKLP